MDSNQIPPLPPQAPPPLQPVTPHHNPYDFITNPRQPPKKRLLASAKGGSKLQRTLIFGTGLVVFLLLVIIVMSLLNKSSTNLKTDYTSLLQQQTELIRITDIGVSKARDNSIKNFAITTKFTLISQQTETTKLAKQTGADASAKTLALSKNTKTDTELTAAEQNNQFDVVFGKTLILSLQAYQQTLKRVRNASGVTAKTTLDSYYGAVNKLIAPTP